MNAQTEISRMRDEIMLRLKIAYRDLDTLREICEHPNVSKRHGNNSGYDYDHYWTDFNCPDCKKSWTVDGSV